MISKLPRWIEYGAFVLAFIAGCINAIGVMGFEHQSVSHLSGTATLMGTSILTGTLAGSLHLGGILLAFFIGAAISGFLLHGGALKLGRHYDTALLIESLLIFTAFYFLSEGSSYGHYAASAACGIQNAMATTYSGAIVRTTHLTGIFTDLGIMLGKVFRGEAFEKRKAILFGLIISGFVIGGVFGAYLFGILKFKALLVPGLACLALAGCYKIYAFKSV
ncbi:YoaK family protein [Marinobacter sp. CHS3-4]|uniref:YoaK family protein n=1 Tax=Marinobacter sp. CHS3-4 TaxID=3045174 RepID=UPI0024B5236A|nr:YoaK family protein [Marinobacter sp. CHS3-4]MDI9246181.1 YoaK family protein [Marinobacter sp. CHS3-4]